MRTLKEFLQDWTDPEDAMYYLACILGIMEYHEINTSDFFEYYRKVKGVFAVKTTEGDMLYYMLEQLTRDKVLEKRDDWEYRWNKSYKGYWEVP